VYDVDNKLYDIKDLEANQMDPQQFLILDCVTMAMEDAGITRQQLVGSKTGVFIGKFQCQNFLKHRIQVPMEIIATTIIKADYPSLP
jgi:myxalamid-type polyketide synthase MxaE and MxaD